MINRNSKILVTGGTGYIGSHTVVELQQSGFDVYLIDNLSNSSIEVLDRIEQITGIRPHFTLLDLKKRLSLNEYFNINNDFNGVIHFAASKAVGESVQKPLEYYENNITGLINLLSEMKNHNVDNLVFSSSCTVYGQPEILPVTEHTPIKPAISPYGNTKKISEDIISDTVNATDTFKAISLRYFNPVGAHSSALIGELPIGIPNNLMPFITQTAIGKRDKLKVYGKDYNTPDGTAIRDYIHVVDLAKAHIKALERILNEKMILNYEVFNLGTGNGFSVLEVINAFEKSTGINLKWEFAPRREGDIEQIWADSTYANNELCWKAEFGIEEMTKSAWEWEKKLIVNSEK